MILETKENKEYHANGMLAYTETVCILSEASAGLYANRRLHPDGYSWIRVGVHEKWFDNGIRAWQIEYDNLGDVIKNGVRSRRKDGTYID